MPDLLQQSASAYLDLSRYSYTIIGGKNQKILTATLSFPLDAYHHLAGFQYSRLESLRLRKPALMNVLSGAVSHQMLLDSGFQHSDRLECIILLQDCLESSQFIFRYLGLKGISSTIKADYLMQWQNIVFFFSDSTPVSIFRNVRNINYAMNSPRYTVLKIIRRNISTDEVATVYEW